MILVFDVGNTETTVGVFDGDALHSHWRLTTDVTRTPDELALTLRGLLAAAGIAPGQLQGAAIGSVVPSMTDPLSEACALLAGLSPVVVDARSPLPITLDVLEPLTVGADRIINTLAASRLHKRRHDRRRPRDRHDLRLHHRRRRLPGRRDRAGHSHVGGDALSAHVQACRRRNWSRRRASSVGAPRSASGPGSCWGQPTRWTGWCAGSSRSGRRSACRW